MKFKKIEKVHQGVFIDRYNIEYETSTGRPKIYEMISRNHDMKDLDDLTGGRAEAVVMMVFDESGEKILLNKEFRMAVGEWVYNFPAGLMEKGEDFGAAAARELKEETGLELYEINDVWKESYSAIGFSNEKNVVVVGRARGTLCESDSELEEIEAAWYTKQEVRQLLKTARFAARTQACCVMWSR